MSFIGIGNGVLRQTTYGKVMDELSAHQVSTFTGIIFFGLFVWFIFPWLGIESSAAAWRTGFVWLGLTVAFEFLFGHYVIGHPWERLFMDYNILKGRLWILVLIWITVAPAIIRILRSK